MSLTTRVLGRTAVRIPEIGLGTWGYHGGPEPLKAGFERGALFVDTAESYGSEPVVGAALKGLRDQVFVATKVSPSHFRAPDLIRAADASLLRLGVDHVDLLQLHEPNPSIPIQETLGAMEDLVDSGKIRFIGVSNFSVDQLTEAMRSLRRYPIASNQVRYNLADRTIETELLPFCRAHGVTVIAYSPLGREVRRLLDCDPDGILTSISEKTGRTLAQIALNWCLAQEGVVVIPKGNSTAHVVENCGASGWNLSPDDKRRLDTGIRFRRRSRWEMILRRSIPRSWGPMAKRMISRLPAGLRRRIR